MKETTPYLLDWNQAYVNPGHRVLERKYSSDMQNLDNHTRKAKREEQNMRQK